jgi:hypothetical protein
MVEESTRGAMSSLDGERKVGPRWGRNNPMFPKNTYIFIMCFI